MIYIVFAFPICSVYCNTLLANLNARAYLRSQETICNIGTDLFTSSSSRVAEGTHNDEQHGPAMLVPSAHQVCFNKTNSISLGYSDDNRRDRELQVGRPPRWRGSPTVANSLLWGKCELEY